MQWKYANLGNLLVFSESKEGCAGHNDACDAVHADYDSQGKCYTLLLGGVSNFMCFFELTLPL